MTNTIKTIGKIAEVTPLAAVGTYFTLLMAQPELTIDATSDFISAGGYLPLKTICGFSMALVLIHNRKKIYKHCSRRIVWWLQDLSEVFTPVERDDDELDGIPHTELLHHLFTVKSFKRDDIENKFVIPRYKVQEIGEGLERVGVLVRGPNNSRVLNEEFSRADVASIVKNANCSRELKPLFREKNNGFTSLPSAKEVENEIEEMATVSHASHVQVMRDHDGTDVQPKHGFISRELVTA